MSTSPSPRKQSRKAPVKDRRSGPGVKGTTVSLRRLKGLLSRPLGLEQRDGHLHVVLVDRRRATPDDQPPPLPQLCAELRARLLIHGHDDTAHVMRHLVFVHDELGRKGWHGVEALPSQVLGKALVQAEMLASEEPSPSLAMLVESLRSIKVAADLREEHKSRSKEIEAGGRIEVSASTYEEFEEMERSWVGTLPLALAPPNCDK
jgi:hypothetical protein